MKTRTLIRLSLIYASGVVAALAQSSVSVIDHQSEIRGGDWHPAFQSALDAVMEHGRVVIPAGPEYYLSAPVLLNRSVQLEFEPGVVVRGGGESLFQVIGAGNYTFKGEPGFVTLINSREDRIDYHPLRKIAVAGISSVIDLNAIAEGKRPSLRVSGIHFQAMRGIDGAKEYRYQPQGGGLTLLDIRDCTFETSDVGVSHGRSSIDTVYIANCTFTGTGNYGLYLPTLINQAATIQDNLFLDIGIRVMQIAGGRAFAIADGTTDDASNIIVHNNRIIGGGHAADESVSYTHGILVYGNQISIQGNLIRDFNRGEPIPDQALGHHHPTSDGGYIREVWIPREDGQRARRLAGAAIYAKARYGIISGNICVNSGWRSVIEVKTGNREPYVLVSNNVMDGSALAAEGSFGIETNVLHSLWSNNIIANMPALAARAYNEQASALINNLIVNSPIGFHAFGSAQREDSLVAGNVFFDVAQPIHNTAGASNRTTSIAAPPSLIVDSPSALPPASHKNRGQLAIVPQASGDRIYASLIHNGAPGWFPIIPNNESTSHAPLQVVSPAPLDPTQVTPVRDLTHLLVNHDHSADGPSFPHGWKLTTSLRDTPPKTIAAYDNEVKSYGSRTLRIGDHDELFNWTLFQNVNLEPGKSYLVETQAFKNTRNNRMILRVRIGDHTLQSVIPRMDEWVDAELAFTVPENSDGRVQISIWSDMTGAGNNTWVGPTTLYEVEPI